MHIPKWILGALVALPLVLAGVFGWILWDEEHLSDDELHGMVDDTARDLESAYYRDHMPATVGDNIRAALDHAALRHDAPLPHVSQSGYDTTDNTTGRGNQYFMTYYFTVSAERGGGGTAMCLEFAQKPDYGTNEGRGLFTVKKSDGKCDKGK